MQEPTIWQKFVDKQLKYRYWIIAVFLLITIFFSFCAVNWLNVTTNFYDLYPPSHPYIKLYKKYRKMFGSANVMTIILKRTDGKTIYNPDTLKRLNELTLGVLKIKGVNPLQVSSAVDPNVKQIVENAYGIGIQPLIYPSVGYPKTKRECEIFKKTVYSNVGIRGFYIGLNDKSAVVYAGLWEDGLNFSYLYKAVKKLTASVEDKNVKCYVTGYPMLYAWLAYYRTDLVIALGVSILLIILILGLYFKSSRGVIIPLASGLISGIWGLGFAGLTGLNLDPLLLVIPILLSARALSHSCQCMDRYHQEYAVLGDKRKALVYAYGELFKPCVAGTLTDGLGCLSIAIASIPLMQKLAYIASFWVIAILATVTITNPIILYFLPAPNVRDRVKLKSWLGKKTRPSFWSRAYQRLNQALVRMSGPRLKWVMLAIVIVLVLPGGYTTTHLEIGNSSAGGAILYKNHPYNVAAKIMDTDYLGKSRLVVIVKGKKKGAIKDQRSLETMEDLGNFMKNNVPEVGGTLSLTDLVRRINRMYHDGSPKWSTIPYNKKYLGIIFFMLGSNMSPGEMDRYVSLPNYTNSNVTAFFRHADYSIVNKAIAETQKFANKVNNNPKSKVKIKLASGILGILAAINQEVAWSYLAILIVIFSTIFLLMLLVYRSIKTAFILVIPVFVAQVLCDLFMRANHIELNINSLPVSSIGVGVGIDYAIYLMSRLKEECQKASDFETAKLMALTTTGKTIMFVALTLSLALVPWLFSPIKFQARMGLLMLFLMIFNMISALVFVPSLTAIFKPKFVKEIEST